MILVRMRQVLKSLSLAVVLFLVCSSVLLSQNLADEEYYEDFSQEHEWFTEYWNATGFIEITEENDGYMTSVACPYTVSGHFLKWTFYLSNTRMEWQGSSLFLRTRRSGTMQCFWTLRGTTPSTGHHQMALRGSSQRAGHTHAIFY